MPVTDRATVWVFPQSTDPILGCFSHINATFCGTLYVSGRLPVPHCPAAAAPQQNNVPSLQTAAVWSAPHLTYEECVKKKSGSRLDPRKAARSKRAYKTYLTDTTALDVSIVTGLAVGENSRAAPLSPRPSCPRILLPEDSGTGHKLWGWWHKRLCMAQLKPGDPERTCLMSGACRPR